MRGGSPGGDSRPRGLTLNVAAMRKPTPRGGRKEGGGPRPRRLLGKSAVTQAMEVDLADLSTKDGMNPKASFHRRRGKAGSMPRLRGDSSSTQENLSRTHDRPCRQEGPNAGSAFITVSLGRKDKDQNNSVTNGGAERDVVC